MFSESFTLKSFVILNFFQDNVPPLRVILKQVQDDENMGSGFQFSLFQYN